MNFNDKNFHIAALALSLSTSILLFGYGSFVLAEEGILDKRYSLALLIVYVFYTFFIMIRYARNKKN